MRHLSGNWPHLARKGEPPGFSQVAAGALDLHGELRDPLWWPQERPVPMQVARGPLGIPLPSMPGPKTLCVVGPGNLGFLSSADMDLGVLLESPQGSQSLSRVGACTWAFLPRCSSRVTLPFTWIKGCVAFPPGFPPRLSHKAFPQGCPTCHRGVSRSPASKSRLCRENRFPWNGLRHLGDSWNGGTTLEFLSPFLWRAPILEMRRERREFFPEHAGKGSLFSN